MRASTGSGASRPARVNFVRFAVAVEVGMLRARSGHDDRTAIIARSFRRLILLEDPPRVHSSEISSWTYLLYPDLRKFDAQDRSRALAKAKDARLDAIELVGVAVGLLMTVLITRYSAVDLSLSGRFAMTLANFIIAIPLLGVLVGPFLVRRTRRSLKAQLEAPSDQ